MDRRSFLRSLAAGAIGAATYDWDRLLWVPGERTIFIPSDEVFTGNTFLTPTWITKEVAQMFVNELKFMRHINRAYDDTFRLG